MTGDPFARVPGAVTDETGLRHLGNPLGEQRALAVRARGRAPGRSRRCSPCPVRTGCRGSTRSRRRRSRASRRVRAPSFWSSTRTDTSSMRHPSSTTARRPGSSSIAATPRVCCSWLRKMRFRLRVDPRDASEEYAVIGGTRAALDGLTAAAPAGLPLVWVDPWPRVAPGGYAYAAVGAAPRHRARLGRGDRPARRGGADRGCRRLGRARTGRPRRRRCAAHRGLAPPLGERGRRARAARTSSTGSARRCTSRRAATAARRPSRRCTTSVIRPGASSRCSSTAATPCSRRTATRCSLGERRRRRRSRLRRCTSKRDRSRSRSCAATPPSTPRSSSDTAGRRRSSRRRRSIVPPEAGATANVPRLPRLSVAEPR